MEPVASAPTRRNIGTDTVVRCSQGHLFTTTWIPLASVKAVRLGWRTRYQRCPVGRHWALVRRLRDDEVTDEVRAEAQHTDSRLP